MPDDNSANLSALLRVMQAQLMFQGGFVQHSRLPDLFPAIDPAELDAMTDDYDLERIDGPDPVFRVSDVREAVESHFRDTAMTGTEAEEKREERKEELERERERKEIQRLRKEERLAREAERSRMRDERAAIEAEKELLERERARVVAQVEHMDEELERLERDRSEIDQEIADDDDFDADSDEEE